MNVVRELRGALVLAIPAGAIGWLLFGAFYGLLGFFGMLGYVAVENQSKRQQESFTETFWKSFGNLYIGIAVLGILGFAVMVLW